MSRLATATDGVSVYGAGGLNSARVSTDRIVKIDPTTGAEQQVGTLAVAVHDAAAVWASGQLVIIGGGSDTASDLIQTWTPGGMAKVAAHLPEPRADLAAVADGGTIYVLGGASGTLQYRDVLAIDATTWKVRVVAKLVHGNRYGSAVLFDHKILLLGGEVTDGVSINEVVEIDPASGAVTPGASLLHSVSHAGVATIGGGVLLIGGRRSDAFSSELLMWSPTPGAVVLTIGLAQRAADPGVALVGSTVVVVGGERNHESVADVSLIKLGK